MTITTAHHPEARFQSPADLVAHCKAEYARRPPGGHRRIIIEAAARRRVSVQDILGSSQRRDVAAARADVAIAIASRFRDLTLDEIGALVGNRSGHTIGQMLQRSGLSRRGMRA